MVIRSLGLWLNRPEGPKIGAKQPVSERVIFRLHWIGFWGKVGLATEHEIPRFTPDCTARHWRALLFLSFAYSESYQARRGKQAA
jgi:hypothetical protein